MGSTGRYLQHIEEKAAAPQLGHSDFKNLHRIVNIMKEVPGFRPIYKFISERGVRNLYKFDPSLKRGPVLDQIY